MFFFLMMNKKHKQQKNILKLLMSGNEFLLSVCNGFLEILNLFPTIKRSTLIISKRKTELVYSSFSLFNIKKHTCNRQ
jgi:hypothetical protein